MKIKAFYLYFIIVLGILALSPDKLNAQEPTSHLYSILVKQSFTSWGNCSSNPDFEYADIRLKFNNSPEQSMVIYTGDLYKILDFEHVFINEQQNKDFSTLKDENGNVISEITVNTHASDIKNDKDLNYTFDLTELVLGKVTKSNDASDPCNNLISSNREGYTMTTTVYIDDPIYMTNTGDDNYVLDYEILTLQVDNYYENGQSTKPVLEVAPSGTEDWEPLTNVIIKPNSTIYLPYETVAGKKSVTTSHFYEWMEKPLQFRIVKKLLNNKKTTGNIIAGIRFYPEGLQYTILQTRRTYCTNDISIFVKLENSDDQGYFDLDPSLFFWQVSSGSDMYNCSMQETDEPSKYKIIVKQGGMPAVPDPFDEPNAEPIEWKLQLIDMNKPGSFACERNFTIPGKPDPITITQKPPIYNISGIDYHLLNMNNPYVMLEIDDPDDFSYLRKPYQVTDGSNILATIDDLPETYENMTQQEKDAIDAEFEEHFIKYTNLEIKPNNSYKAYFYYRYKQWMDSQNATSPDYRIVDPLGTYEYYAYIYHSHEHTHTCTHTHSHTHTCMDEHPGGGYIGCTTSHEISANADLCSTSHIHITDDTRPYDKVHSHSHTHTRTHTHIHTHVGDHAHGEDPQYNYGVIKKYKTSTQVTTNVSTLRNKVSNASLVRDGFNTEYIIRSDGNNISTTIWTEDYILNNVYPDHGVALEWYNDYKAIYKVKWLNQQLGVKVDNNILVNQNQDLTLIDGDGCEYPFTIHVKAPPIASFSTSIISNPSDACAKDGKVRITYNNGGVLPYVHSAGTLNRFVNQIIVDGLGYGENTICFTDGAGHENASITVTIGSATRGITGTPALPQTCSPANGSITVNVGSIPGSKTYTLTNENTNEKYVHTTLVNLSKFDGLPAGSYMAEVESGTCYFSETGINVASQIFGITTPIPTDATLIDGTGSVTMSFINRTNNVTWISGVPTVFNTSENTDNIGYSGVESGIYNFTARHIDNYSRTCNISGSFEVEEPSFEANINIEETDNKASISISLTDGNSLITPYHFRLFNSSGSEVATGENNSSFSTLVQINDTYTLNMVYGANNLDIYTLDYPSTAITNDHSIIPPVCPGGDGLITFNPSGGIDGSDLLISTDGVTYNATTNSVVKGGDFTYYIKDENTSYFDVSGNAITLNRSLINTFNIPITNPIPVNAGIVIPIDVTCAGSNDGKVSIDNLSGGSGTYQYRVDNGSWKTPQTETPGLAPGKHIIYLQDSYNDCPAVTLSNFHISEPDSLKIDSVRIVQPTCEQENGEIFIKAMGGNGLYQFDWTKNGSSFYSNNTPEEDTVTHLGDSLQYGFYRLNIIDNKNCSLTYNVELNEYFNPQITNADITDVRCYGETNGEIKINEVTGTNPFNKIVLRGLDFIYKDSIYTLADSFNSLPKGRYELEVIDDSACVSNSPYSITVHQPDTILYAIIDTIVPVLQKGLNTGKIYSTVYGGNDGLKTLSLLDSDNVTIDQQFERNQFPAHFDSLYAGNYSLNIIDRKGCTYNLPIQTVLEPQIALGFNVVQKKDAMCKAQTGNFTVEGFGGWGEYSYKRATDNGYYKINSFKNLYAGSYIVSVSDKYGAVFTDTLVIYEPKDSLQASLIGFSDPTCGSNGSLLLNLNGGIAPYKIYFDNSSDTTDIAIPQEYTITDRPTGSYLLHVEDDNGCKFELETSLSDQDLIEIVDFDLNYPSTEVSNDGTIKAYVRGGKSSLSFSWKELFGSSLAETSSILTNASSGHYELTVSEQDGCSKSKRVYLPAVTDLPLEIIELKNETSYQAQNGSAQLHSNLESLLNVEVINPEGIRTIYNINDSTAKFYENNHNLYLRNLKGGSYFVMATNNLGEKAYAEFEIKPYDQFYFEDIQISHLKEMNDSSGIIRVVVAGGAGGNSFVWEYLDGGVIQMDTINSEFTGILENAIAGNYRVTVSDKYNNSISQIITIDQPSTPLEITISEFQNESCKDYEDAYAIVKASGGWGDYQYRQDAEKYYSNNDTWTNIDVREHYFYLTDKMGAIDSIALNISEPEYLRANVEFIDSVDCKSDNNGNILFNITGGTAPYRFLMQEPLGIWTQDTVARNLAEGDYSFIFTDNNDCVGQDTIYTYMPEPDSLLFNNIDITHTTCNTDNGAITVAMQGGTHPYRYTWKDFGGNVLGNENSVSGLRQNSLYFLNVMDAHNCQQQYEQLINPSTNPIIVNIDTTRVLCHGGNTGTAHIVEVTPAVPFAPYTFLWSNSDTGEYSEGYKAGIHSVAITDTNNCSTVKYFEVTQPDTLQLEVIDFKDAHCYGYNDAFVEIQASGGVGDYRFNWSNGETIPRIESLYKGTYGVTITDDNLCSIQDIFEIVEPNELTVDLGDDIRICPGNSINIDGQEFTTYQWSNSNGVFSNERFISVDTEDNYYLEVTDSIGCYAHDEISITIGNDALQADFLMSSAAILGDTLFIYEISNIELDSLYWDYNIDAFNSIFDNDLSNYMLQLESNQLGIFNVALWAYSGGCISMLVKQVEIIQSNDTINDNNYYIGYTDPLISELSIYPNPTDGNFAVKVVLREISDIQINLFSVNQGVIINQRKENGQDYYEIDYRLNGLNTGVYVIIVTAKNESKQIKIIVE